LLVLKRGRVHFAINLNSLRVSTFCHRYTAERHEKPKYIRIYSRELARHLYGSPVEFSYYTD